MDRPGWRRFFLALFSLALSFFLALLSAAFNFSGRHDLGAPCAFLALVIAGIVAVKVVPYLARRTALERWMIRTEYEFTREGAIYLMLVAGIVVAALNTGNNLLFIILASLLAGILVSGILSKIVLSDLELEFNLPEHLFAGQPIISRLTLKNRKWFLPSFSVAVAGREADDKRGSAGSGASPRQILDEPVYLPFIPRRATVTQHVEITFPRRGRYAQEGFCVSTKFPFGFMRKIRQVASRQEILVLPGIEPADRIAQLLSLVSGEVESFFKGQGHDLYSIRDYQESDTARHVDWKASARAQQLKVREFTREDDCRVRLAFDARMVDSSPDSLLQFEKAVQLCACLAWHFSALEAQMQFLTHDTDIKMAPARDVVFPALEALAQIEPKLQTASALSPWVELSAPASEGDGGFQIIITCLPSGSAEFATSERTRIIPMDSL